MPKRTRSDAPTRTRWAAAPPSSPGFYWRRPRGRLKPEIVRVTEQRGTLHVLVCGTEGATPLEEMGGAHQWLGPLPTPR